MTTFPRLKAVPKPGAQARTSETVEAILNATLTILMRDGYAALSLRRVAGECGMRVGNLSYHFPTKQDLVNGLLDAVLEGYRQNSARIEGELPSDDRDRIRDGVIRVLLDIQSYQTTLLFPELWSMANHDPMIQAKLQEFYRESRQQTIDLIMRVNGRLDRDRAETLALYISSFIEGSTLFAGHGKPYAARMPALAAIAIRGFVHLVETLQPQDLEAVEREWEAARSAAPSPSIWMAG